MTKCIHHRHFPIHFLLQSSPSSNDKRGQIARLPFCCVRCCECRAMPACTAVMVVTIPTILTARLPQLPQPATVLTPKKFRRVLKSGLCCFCGADRRAAVFPYGSLLVMFSLLCHPSGAANIPSLISTCALLCAYMPIFCVSLCGSISRSARSALALPAPLPPCVCLASIPWGA